MLIHTLVEQILRAISKFKRELVIALVILPDQTLKKYIQNFATITAPLNLVLTTETLEDGMKMKDLKLRFLPGQLIAIMINTLEANRYAEILPNRKLEFPNLTQALLLVMP
ncbi:MAG: hypothetical protein EZS28_015960 [Streblomastix strix]|uniref:Uncharacterized protein n=1 Tax=Streblomastix strix TaxID=222440 RepID=A0A5J4W1V0_9EUKA|nr:MAG: hypothetical protein EZS28_015960 [Streblomastix strix]